ncbi:MAG: peptidylprolyl isomerase [bacterium]
MKFKAIKIMLLMSVVSISILSYSIVFAQKKGGDSENIKKEIIGEIGPEKVSYEHLEKAFQKNMNRKDTELYKIPKDSIIDFLKLYSNYRLKVLDAIDRGFDKDSAVMEDIQQNRKLLAETFYFEKTLINPWIEQMLNFRNNEYKIAIMVFSFPPVPNPDTMDTYIKAKACLDLLKKKVPFETVAMDSSDDPETGRKGGEVGSWITAGNVQRPIESAILSLNPGEFFNDLIKTRYGYFLVKLLDKQPRILVKGQHILFSFDPDIDSTIIIQKAEEVLKALKKGEDFAKFAKEYSADPNTAKTGGVMEDYYSRSTGFEKTNTRLVPQFEEALFSLKDGELSGLVYTSYGIHIIKRLASKDFVRDEEIKSLKLIYKKSYFEEDKKNFYDTWQNKFQYKLNDDILTKFVSFLDTNKTNLDKEWIKNVPNDFYREILFVLNNRETSIGEFVKMLAYNSELRGLGLNLSGMSKALNKIISPMVFKEATKNLETDYPEFANLMQEFHDGILLFKVEQMEVWDKLKIDTLLARQYWDSTKTRYKTKQAYDISEIYVLSDSLATDLYNQLQNGEDFQELATKQTQRKGFREKKGYWGEVTDEENDLVKAIKESNAKPGSVLQPIKYEKGFSIIRYNKFLPLRQKTFEEAIPDFAPQVQDLVQKRLLNDWLKRIQTKFQLKIYDKKIDSIIAQMKKKK